MGVKLESKEKTFSPTILGLGMILLSSLLDTDLDVTYDDYISLNALTSVLDNMEFNHPIAKVIMKIKYGEFRNMDVLESSLKSMRKIAREVWEAFYKKTKGYITYSELELVF